MATITQPSTQASSATTPAAAHVIQHPGEPRGNAWRVYLDEVEPICLRTYTPSLAIIARSAGCYHWTSDGRKLADFTSGVLVANIGHNPVQWWERVWKYMGLSGPQGAAPAAAAAMGPATLVAEQSPISTYYHAVPLTAYNAATELEIEACQRLIANMRQAPGGGRMEQVLWSASGSEAIQKAIWAAMRRRPGSDVVLATRRGFHGKKGLAGAVTGSELDHERDPRVRFISFPTTECADIELRRQPLDLTRYEKELEQLAAELGDRLCAIVTEPYLGGGGSYHPQVEYMQLLERFCRQHDLVFILDEIQANVGRTGPMYSYTHYGVEPDVVCLGKGLGNGIPVNAAVGSRAVLGVLKFGEGSDTWSANPLGCASVLATLDEFETRDILGHGQQLSQVLERGLVRLKETGVIAQVRGEGTVWGIECAAVGDLAPEQVAVEVVRRCYLGDQRGRAIHLLGPLAGKVIRISPPLVMPLNEAHEYLDAMWEIIRQIGAGGR